jgi:hypothetical protein
MDITRKSKLTIGSDRPLSFVVYEADGVTPKDVTGLSFAFVISTTDDDVLVTKETGGGDITVTGAYNVDPALNAQRVIVQLRRTDTYDPNATPPLKVEPGAYIYALRLTQTDSRQDVAFGTVELLNSAARHK